MKRHLVIFLIILLVSFSAVITTIFILDSSGVPNHYRLYEIDSKFLTERREIIVKPPMGYSNDSKKRYPVVYISGGNSLTFNIAYDTELLSRLGHIPELIIVGIPNINQKTRQRDLTPPSMKQDLDFENSPLGQADIYLDYIEQEVIPLIEREFRANDTRLLIGHSREGLMTLYSLLTKHDLFQGYMALSPAVWREKNIFIDQFANSIKSDTTINTFLYMSMGRNEVDKMTSAFDAVTRNLKEHAPPSLRWYGEYTEGAIHSNNAQLSAPEGISKFFKNRIDQ